MRKRSAISDHRLHREAAQKRQKPPTRRGNERKENPPLHEGEGDESRQAWRMEGSHAGREAGGYAERDAAKLGGWMRAMRRGRRVAMQGGRRKAMQAGMPPSLADGLFNETDEDGTADLTRVSHQYDLILIGIPIDIKI